MERFGGDGEDDNIFFFFFCLFLKYLHQNGSNKVKQEGRGKEEIIKGTAPSPSSNLWYFSPMLPSANITLVAGKPSSTGDMYQ